MVRKGEEKKMRGRDKQWWIDYWKDRDIPPTDPKVLEDRVQITVVTQGERRVSYTELPGDLKKSYDTGAWKENPREMFNYMNGLCSIECMALNEADKPLKGLVIQYKDYQFDIHDLVDLGIGESNEGDFEDTEGEEWKYK